MPRPSLAAQLVGIRSIGDPEIVRARLAERDQRQAADNRSDIQRWLGDPALSRSALGQRCPPHVSEIIARLIFSLRR